MTYTSLFFLCQIFYVPAITLLKASVGLFLLRISVRNVHIWSIRITIIATGLFGLYFFIVTVLQCRSLSNYWTVERKKCISFSVLEYSSYVWSALNAAADWTFGLLPAFIIRDLQMSRQNKAIISGVLGFAAMYVSNVM